jgi:TRAP-type mannitol/chloroaromatic compound transport system permease small subunit
MTFHGILTLLDLALYFHLVLPILLLVCAAALPQVADMLASYLLPLAKALDSLAKHIGHAAAWLSLAMVLVMSIVVILRYVFGLSFIWMQESLTYMHGMLFLLVASYTLWVDGHVRVDIFYRTAPERRKALTDLLGTYFFLFPFMFLIIDTALPYVTMSWSVQEGSRETSGIQGIYLLKGVILLFAYLMILQGLSTVIHRAAWLAGMEETVDHEAAATSILPGDEGDAP